jgi:hypothetical protein
MKQIGVNAIANDAITAPKLDDFAVTNSKLSPQSVSSSKLQDFSVTRDKLFPESFSLPVAQRPGLIVDLPPDTNTDAVASCLSGEQVIGGGHAINADDTKDFRNFASFVQGNSWVVRAINAGVGAMSVQSMALCALDFPL